MLKYKIPQIVTLTLFPNHIHYFYFRRTFFQSKPCIGLDAKQPGHFQQLVLPFPILVEWFLLKKP